MRKELRNELRKKGLAVKINLLTINSNNKKTTTVKVLTTTLKEWYDACEQKIIPGYFHFFTEAPSLHLIIKRPTTIFL